MELCKVQVVMKRLTFVSKFLNVRKNLLKSKSKENKLSLAGPSSASIEIEVETE